MVPRAANGLALDQAFGEWPVIVAALRVDGEDFRPRAHQHHALIANMTEQGRTGELAQGNAPGEIGTGGSRLLIGHVFLRCGVLRQSTIPKNSCRVTRLRPVRRIARRKVPAGSSVSPSAPPSPN